MKSENFETGNGDDTEEETNNEEEKVTSSIENIIPVKQISHGWKVLQGFAMKACHVTMDKVDEINHSQTMENVKSSTSHAWTKTKEVSYDAAEKTKVLAMKINEDMKPVSEKVVHNAKIGWDYASETVKTTTDIAIDVTTKAVQNISSVLSENEEES